MIAAFEGSRRTSDDEILFSVALTPREYLTLCSPGLKSSL